MLITVWLLAQFSLIAVAIIDPRLGGYVCAPLVPVHRADGHGLILFLALRGQDRALSLIPTWILFLVWIFGAGVALTGKLTGEAAVFGLVFGHGADRAVDRFYRDAVRVPLGRALAWRGAFGAAVALHRG